MTIRTIPICTPTFNRTSLELKPRQGDIGGGKSLPFNRTSLELKQIWLNAPCQSCRTFNRTSLELKRDAVRLIRGMARGLLIAPVWN